MKLSKTWRKLLLLRRHRQPRGRPKEVPNESSCFDSWIRGYRERLQANKDAGARGSRIPVVALIVSDKDREVLTSVMDREAMEIHFAKSRVEAWDVMSRLNAPVILYDRDWPDAEWRTSVHTFARAAQRACVILASRVADDYLWQELVRCGGYDLVPKPLREEDVTRALALAVSYWKSARAAGA